MPSPSSQWVLSSKKQVQYSIGTVIWREFRCQIHSSSAFDNTVEDTNQNLVHVSEAAVHVPCLSFLYSLWCEVLGGDFTNACVFTPIEPTRIELTPKRTELTVGESIVLSCKAIHDSSLDVTFYWTLKGQPIDFEKEGGHFENIRAVSL